LKGKERVCHVTEADRPRPPDCDPGVAPIREVSSCEAAMCMGFCPCARRRYGVFRGFLRRTPGIKRREGHLVDALALRGDEGRGTLRKARGRCERSAIPGYPNGATHPQGYHDLNS
jgi:hypothetical protein